MQGESSCSCRVHCRSKKFVERMLIEPDIVIWISLFSEPDNMIWISLFSASQFHGNFQMAETEENKITDSNQMTLGYTCFWNMCCSKNQWGEASKTRKMMKEQKVKRKPGLSRLR